MTAWSTFWLVVLIVAATLNFGVAIFVVVKGSSEFVRMVFGRSEGGEADRPDKSGPAESAGPS